jgi:nucleoid-associated protein YgaU
MPEPVNKKSIWDAAKEALTGKTTTPATKTYAQDAAKEAAKKKLEATKKVTKTPQQIAAESAAAVKMRAQQAAYMKAQAAPKILAKHKLTAEQTLSHLSLKYYGHATREYWMVIYEANKAAIGPNPAHVRVGMELIIPELPDALKAKK